jgi:hypothetical protein
MLGEIVTLATLLQPAPVRQHIVCLPRTCHVARANGETVARGAGVLSFTTTGPATVMVAPCGSAPGKVGAK